MAIPADTTFEVQPGIGSDTLCSGGFSKANKGATGVDYSVQAAAQFTFTSDLSGVGTTTLTSAGAHFTNLMLGNLIQITGQGVYCITGFTSASSLIVDRNLGTFSTATGYIGGAYATPGMAASVHVGSNIIFVKGGTSSLSSSNNAAGGRITLTAGSVSASTTIVGYATTRTLANTDATRPIIQPTTSTNNLTCIITNNLCTVRNIDFENGNAGTGCVAIDTGANNGICVENCKINSYKTGIRIAANLGSGNVTGTEIILANESSALGMDSPSNMAVRGCYIHGGTSAGGIGIAAGAGLSLSNSVIANITGSSAVGLQIGQTGVRTENVSIYNMNAYGVDASSGFQGGLLCNVYAEGCGTGIRIGSTADSARVINCAGFNNSTVNYDVLNATALSVVGFISCTASALTAPGSGDFSINNAAGGGALLRNAGFPVTIAGLTQTNNLDVGAYQHASSAAGATAYAF